MADYVIKKVGIEEFSLLIPLVRDCFGMHVDINYFKWKYIDNPAGSFIGFIAEDEKGEVGAYYGVIPEAYIVNGEERIIYQSCDTMTHSAHRRKGLFQKLAIHCYEFLRENNKLFIIGFGGGQSTPGFLKFGWRQIFNIQYYFYLRWFRFFDLFFSAGKKVGNKVIEITQNDQIKELFIKITNESDIFSKKKFEQFNWRISNPLHGYKVLASRADDQSEYNGYLVYYLTDKDVFLFDFYAEDKKCENLLMKKIKEILIKQKKRSVLTFCQVNSGFSKRISRHLFFRNKLKKGPLASITPFIVYSDTENLSMMEKAKWDIMPYDHDAL